MNYFNLLYMNKVLINNGFIGWQAQCYQVPDECVCY